MCRGICKLSNIVQNRRHVFIRARFRAETVANTGLCTRLYSENSLVIEGILFDDPDDANACSDAVPNVCE